MEGKPPPLLAKIICKEVTHKSLYYDIAIFVFLCMEEVKNPVDLGHDDVEGQECKDGRSRTWMLLLYPDNEEHKAVLDGKLNELDWNFAGRVHDKDEGVKEHHHVVVLFKDGRKNTDIAKDLGIDKRWLRAWDRQKKALRYLCHKDNPGKYQYSTDGIYGTIAEKAVAACSKGNELSEQQSIDDIFKMIDDIDGLISYRQFLSLVNQNNLYPVFRRMGNLGIKLIEEHNFVYRQKIDAELFEAHAQESQREHFTRCVAKHEQNPDSVSFADKVKVYEKNNLFVSAGDLND